MPWNQTKLKMYNLQTSKTWNNSRQVDMLLKSIDQTIE